MGEKKSEEREASGSAVRELLNALQYCIDSKRGKYSLETYLEILGEYTDRLIQDRENKGMVYQSGLCSVHRDDDKLAFAVRMYFTDSDGHTVENKAERSLPIKAFTKEALRQIDTQTLSFAIDRPEN